MSTNENSCICGGEDHRSRRIRIKSVARAGAKNSLVSAARPPPCPDEAGGAGVAVGGAVEERHVILLHVPRASLLSTASTGTDSSNSNRITFLGG